MVDLNDYSYKVTSRRGKPVNNKVYRHYCDNCGTDKGYLQRSHDTPTCNKCSHKGRTLSEDHKQKMSEAAGGSNKPINNKLTCQVNGRTHYKDECPKCNKDKGFIQKNNIGNMCRSCANSIAKKGKPSPKKGKPSNVIPWNKGIKYGKVSTIQKKIKQSMKSGISSRLKKRNSSKNKASTFKILSFSLKTLMEHLEKQFYPNPDTGETMTWDNYGKWHLDHVIPDSWFTYSSIEDEGFRKSWSLENLQPLWAKENIRKSNRFAGPRVVGG
jgi:hypothetical protein